MATYLILIVGCLAAAAMGIMQHLPKKWIWLMAAVAIGCQVWTFADQNASQQKTQAVLQGEVAEAKKYAALAEQRALDLQRRTDIMLPLLVKTSRNVNDQDLKRQVEQAVVSAKLDQIASRGRDQNGLGNSSLGASSLGAGQRTSEDRIASALERIERDYLGDLTLERHRGKSSAEILQQYYDGVAKIPAFFTKEDWEHAEGLIASDILSDVRGNLTKRGVYSPERFEGTVKFLEDERKRYRAARSAGKSASP